MFKTNYLNENWFGLVNADTEVALYNAIDEYLDPYEVLVKKSKALTGLCFKTTYTADGEGDELSFNAQYSDIELGTYFIEEVYSHAEQNATGWIAMDWNAIALGNK